MEKLKLGWQKVPVHIRKPTVLIVGGLFVIAAGLTGWLPGPGGIPLFLLGIAILATEFAWAKRIEQFILRYIRIAGQWIKAHLVISVTSSVVLAAATAWLIYYFWFR
jgi:hypothetical protein